MVYMNIESTPYMNETFEVKQENNHLHLHLHQFRCMPGVFYTF